MKHTKKRTERQRKKWALIGLAFFLVATVLICWQVGLAVGGGVLAALIQRLREIKRGEEEDAKKY